MIGVGAALAAAVLVVANARAVWLFTLCVNAARRLHDQVKLTALLNPFIMQTSMWWGNGCCQCLTYICLSFRFLPSFSLLFSSTFSSSLLLFLSTLLLFYLTSSSSPSPSSPSSAQMFAAILRAPVSWFDSNPSGRILNRFSKDQGLTDDQMPATAFDFLGIGLQTLGKWFMRGSIYEI
jgi:ABC-type multidrug transport system fused ATPase/permease subunit